MKDNTARDNSSFSQAVTEQLQKENIIEAIKLIREETGMSLREAKALIDSGKTGISTKQTPVVISSAVLDQLMQGKKIEAIKVLRSETRMGLKEAKDAVEHALLDHPEVNHQFQEINKQGMKSSLFKFFVLCVLAYIAYRWLVVQ